MRFEFIVYSAIQGYHEYKDIWKNPIIGGELKCQREIENRHDPLAVAMLKQIDGHDTIVGHVSRKIAASCNAFIGHGVIIECIVTGNRRYNVDLVQGGLELPCKLRFVISSPSQEFCKKTEISVCFALSETNTFSLDKSTSVIEDDAMIVEIKTEDTKSNHSGLESPPSSSAVAIDDNEKYHAAIDEDSHTNVNSTKSVVHNNIAVELEEVVCSPPKKRLKKFDETIIMGERLTDVEINLAQRILKSQFPNIRGLHSTLFIYRAVQ